MAQWTQACAHDLAVMLALLACDQRDPLCAELSSSAEGSLLVPGYHTREVNQSER